MSKAGGIILNIAICLFVGVAFVASVISIHYFDTRSVKNIVLDITSPDGKTMLTDSVVKKFIAKEIKKTIGTPLRKVEDTIFTNKLYAIGSVEDVNIMHLVNDNILIYIIQKEPVAALNIDGKDGFYVTNNAEVFRSDNYFGDKKLVRIEGLSSDDIKKSDNDLMKEILKLVDFMYVEEEQFIYKIADAVVFNTETGDIELRSKLFGHRIILGDASDMKVKSFNLRAFYEATKDADMARYSALNLKFDNQVVAIIK